LGIISNDEPSGNKQMMRWRNIASMACIGFLLLTAGCSRKSASELKVLSPYSTATLIPGRGLGDLQLGQTTLAWFVDNIGSGAISISVGDESAIELSFLSGEASFLFIISGACQDETGGPGTRLDLNQDIEAFLAKYPGCNDLPLSSISVATRQSSKANTFFQGSTDRGVQLWAPKSEAEKHGVVLNNAGRLVAGEGNENLERLEFPGGIYFYYPAGAGATPEEEVSGRALSPERLSEIEASAKKAAKNAVIKRMTIFIPNG
jgi:hypothetical protein